MEDIIKELQKERPIFHSEADFQHALAWEIHRLNQSAKMRLEIDLVVSSEPREATDILMSQGETTWAIELKYRKKKFETECNGERFCFREHSALDEGRYNFVKDVSRLERLVEARLCTVGYAVFLTNDAGYWKPPRSKKRPSNDDMFRIHEGCTLKHTLSWGKALENRMPLVLKGSYSTHWNDYSEVETDGPGKFRYLLLRVPESFGQGGRA